MTGSIWGFSKLKGKRWSGDYEGIQKVDEGEDGRERGSGGKIDR
jgi:hypothetical protein